MTTLPILYPTKRAHCALLRRRQIATQHPATYPRPLHLYSHSAVTRPAALGSRTRARAPHMRSRAGARARATGRGRRAATPFRHLDTRATRTTMTHNIPPGRTPTPIHALPTLVFSPAAAAATAGWVDMLPGNTSTHGVARQANALAHPAPRAQTSINQPTPPHPTLTRTARGFTLLAHAALTGRPGVSRRARAPAAAAGGAHTHATLPEIGGARLRPAGGRVGTEVGEWPRPRPSLLPRAPPPLEHAPTDGLTQTNGVSHARRARTPHQHTACHLFSCGPCSPLLPHTGALHPRTLPASAREVGRSGRSQWCGGGGGRATPRTPRPQWRQADTTRRPLYFVLARVRAHIRAHAPRGTRATLRRGSPRTESYYR
jgi:hypothetical protein